MPEENLIHTFGTKYTNQAGRPIPVHVFIDNLPPNSIATVDSTLEFGGSWFIVYSVRSGDDRTEFFYELVEDSNETSDYVLNIFYDSTRAICSFDSTEQIIFVDRDNDELVEQPRKMLYEYVVEDRMSREYKTFLIIFKNNFVLFWNDKYAKVTVKKFNLSSFFELYDYCDFSRVEFNFHDLTDERCEMTFYTDPSSSNQYYSAYIDMSFLDSNCVSVVLYDHRFNQMCFSQFSGSQFKPDTRDKIGDFTLKLTHRVDGELQEDAESISDSDANSDSDSDDDY